jgi:choice-of-anchor C domain-containing protein
MNRPLLLLALAALALGGPAGTASAAENLIQNGGFETGYPANPSGPPGSGASDLFWTVGPLCGPPCGVTGNGPGDAIPGWTVTAGDVDWVDGSYWQQVEGRRSIDMTGSGGAGTLRQTIATTPGQPYELTFAFSGNPISYCHDVSGDSYVKVLHVAAGDQAVTFTRDVSSYVDQLNDMRWGRETVDFTATGPSTDVTFTTDQVGCAGPVIDDVSVVAVDSAAPTVTYQGNLGSYTVDQTVDITCVAADPTPGSGVASSTCADLHAPAYTLGLGSHTLSASATDQAGNTGEGSTSFSVTVDAASLCRLTAQLVHGSARYQAAPPRARARVDACTTRLCGILAQIGPELTHRQRKALLGAYGKGLDRFAAAGWLTVGQAATLRSLAAAL